MRSLGPLKCDSVLVKKGKVGHRKMHSGETMGRGRVGMEHLEAKERQTSPVTPKARRGRTEDSSRFFYKFRRVCGPANSLSSDFWLLELLDKKYALF